MTDTLVIDPLGANIIVPCQRAGKAPKRKVGDIDFSGAGIPRSFIRAELDVCPVVLVNTTPAICRAIEAVFANGAQVETRGTVWNRDDTGSTIVTAWAEYTDEMEQGGGWRVPGLTLHEVGTAAGPTTTSTVYLTNVVSSGAVKVASPTASRDDFGLGSQALTLLSGVTIPTCGSTPDPGVNCPIVESVAAEQVWLSDAAIAAGWLTGAPTVNILSVGGTGDALQTQNCRFKLFIVRGGVDVVEWDTGWSSGNGGFAGSMIAAVAPAIVFRVLPGDQLRVEIYARMGLHGGYADTTHQTVTYGNGGTHYGYVTFGGDASAIWP